MEDKKKSVIDDGDVQPARLETLVDGVFAIAMTLLVLDIHVPELVGKVSAGSLFSQILISWPIILSFGVSFIILAMFWVAHHTQYRFIKKLDHVLIWQNLFYLLFVSLFPFSAALLGRYPLNETAVIIYGLHLIMIVVIQYFMWRHASKNKELIVENLDLRINSLADRLGYIAIIAYIIAITLSFWHVEIALIIYALVPLPYIFGWVYSLA